MAGRVLIIGLHFLIQLFQEIVHFVGVAIFKDGEKFIPAVASGKADIGGCQMKDIGEIPDKPVALQVAIVGVDLMKICQIKHNAAEIFRNRFVQISFDHNITAKTVRQS